MSRLIQKLCSTNRKLITAVGINVLDKKLYVDRLPKQGETVLSLSSSQDLGGKAFNQAVQAALVYEGRNVCFVSKTGSQADLTRTAIRERMKALEMPQFGLCEDPHLPSGSSAVLVDNTGDNMIVVDLGANKTLEESDLNRLDKETNIFRDSKIVLCQLECKIETSLRSFQLAGEDAVKVLNVSPLPSTQSKSLNELLSLSTILCVNKGEAKGLSGKGCERVAATQLLSMFAGLELVVVTLGEEGAIYVCREDPLSVKVVKGVKNKNVVDTVGAGDSFLGAFCGFLALRTSMASHEQVCGFEVLNNCIMHANVMASQTVSSRGTQSSYKHRRELELKW